jgi:hypothetical protein
MRHRIFLVPLRADVAVAAGRSHWEEVHAPLFADTPNLRGYVQNRPEDSALAVVCSETWFDDRDAEQAAYTSTFYRDRVTPDEAGFLEREAAWSALVRDDVRTGFPVGQLPGALRALVFGWSGAHPPPGDNVSVLTLDRPGPQGGPERLLSAWGDRPDALVAALEEPGDAHLLVRPRVVVPSSDPAR